MEFDFNDLTVQEVPVKIGGQDYVLKEADGEAAIRYRDASLRAAKFTDGKVSGADGLAAAEAMLLSLCLFKVKADNQARVTEAFVRGLPARVMKKLFNKVKEISDLGEDGTDPKEQALADALAHPDSPATYEAVRDHVRRLVATDPKFGVLRFMLEDKVALVKN